MSVGKIRRAIVEGNLLEKAYRTITRPIWRFYDKNRKRVFRRVDGCIAELVSKKAFANTAVEGDKIVFVTSRGSYNCNPRAIADEIIRQKLPWKLVWVIRKENLASFEQYPEGLELVVRGSYEFYRELASAKVWIDNSVNLSYLHLPKKQGQILIETWHGSFGLKRFETSSDRMWIKKAKHAGARTDYCVTNSEFENALFKRTFWGDSQMLAYGHPRNDGLFPVNSQRSERIAQSVREKLGIAPDKRVALYAPTFRDSRDLSFYDIDYQRLGEALTERFGGDWVILTRFHFELRKAVKKQNIVFPEFVIDATQYPDIQDILNATDVGITDYSSWICDFVLTRKPIFLFVTDLGTFNGERGFYYPLESTPFPIAQDNDTLMKNICDFDEALYQKECDRYLAEVGCLEDGRAAERVVDKLKEIMRTKESLA